MKGFYISVDEMHMLSVYKSRPITTFWDEILDFMSFILIYAFSRRFYPKRLTIAFRLYIFISMCSLGIEPTTFCAVDAMLYHWATQEHVSFICHSVHTFSLVTPETCSQRLSGLVSVANRFWFNVSPGGLLLHCVNWIIWDRSTVPGFTWTS